MRNPLRLFILVVVWMLVIPTAYVVVDLSHGGGDGFWPVAMRATAISAALGIILLAVLVGEIILINYQNKNDHGKDKHQNHR